MMAISSLLAELEKTVLLNLSLIGLIFLYLCASSGGHSMRFLSKVSIRFVVSSVLG